MSGDCGHPQIKRIGRGPGERCGMCGLPIGAYDGRLMVEGDLGGAGWRPPEPQGARVAVAEAAERERDSLLSQLRTEAALRREATELASAEIRKQLERAVAAERERDEWKTGQRDLCDALSLARIRDARLTDRAEAAEATVAKIEAEARRYAAMYAPHTDGRNTFVIFADWIAALSAPAAPEVPDGPQ